MGQKRDKDRFENKLTDLIKTRFSPLPTGLDIQCIEIDGKTVCRIDVSASRRPFYLENKLYVRFGNSTEELTGRSLQDWLETRTASFGEADS